MKLALEAAGFQTMQAKYEAEALCAHLGAQNEVWAVLTEDTDSLVFGAPRVIFKFFDPEPLVISQTQVLESLGFTFDQFIDFCMLLGCDFCETVYLVGPCTAKKLLDAHGSWSGIYEALLKKNHPSKTVETAKAFQETYARVRQCFTGRAFELDLNLAEPVLNK
jgi:flap endonuclease-1